MSPSTSAGAAAERVPSDGLDPLERLDVALSRLRRLWDQPGVRTWFSGRIDLDAVEASVFRTLRAVDQLEPDGASVNGVAELLRIDASTASRFLDRASSAAFVRRAPSPDDRRRSSFTLTDLGRDQLAELREARVQLLGALTADWTTADIDILVELLTRLDGAVAGLGPEHGH